MFEPGGYLNVDLEITSTSSLGPLLEVLDAHMMVVGTWHKGRTH